MSKNGIQTPNFAHKIETCINPFRKWCTTYFIILMMQSWDQLGKTNTKTRQKLTELKEKSPFTIRKGSAELMLFVTKFQTTWSNLSMKREAQFSIFIYNVKKTESKILRQILCFIVRGGLCWNYTISSGNALFWIIITKTLFENVTIQCLIVEMDIILIIMVSVCWERHIDMYYFDEYFVVLCIWLTITCVIGTILYVYLIFICFMNKIFWE